MFDSLSFLSIIVVTLGTKFSSIPDSKIKPVIKFLLLYLIITSIFNFLNAVTYNDNNSASIYCPSIPTTSASHWVNSLSLPTLTGPSLNTLFISYRLNGNEILFLFKAINLANGTVKSYLRPKHLSP